MESGRREEQDLVPTAVQDQANPEPEPKKRKARGKYYAAHSDEQHAVYNVSGETTYHNKAIHLSTFLQMSSFLI